MRKAHIRQQHPTENKVEQFCFNICYNWWTSLENNSLEWGPPLYFLKEKRERESKLGRFSHDPFNLLENLTWSEGGSLMSEVQKKYRHMFFLLACPLPIFKILGPKNYLLKKKTTKNKRTPCL
jgi:hypothetical protein